jgi:predicted Zn-dependent protease
VFVVDRPTIPPGEVDLAVRGEALRPADINNQAALALDRADSGDVKGAISELEALVAKHPESRRAGLALGALQLRDGRNAEAQASLDRIRPLKTDAGMDDEVDWYLAIARVRMGDGPGARPLLEVVCKRAGPRSARACAGVAEIR